MAGLGETVKVATGKIEAVIAGAILIAVVVLFAKYYERPADAAQPAAARPAATKPAIE